MRNGVLTFSAAFLWLEGVLGVAKDERMCFFLFPGVKVLTCAQTVKLIFTILLSYPLAGVLKRLPDAEPAKKNLFMIGYGTWLNSEHGRGKKRGVKVGDALIKRIGYRYFTSLAFSPSGPESRPSLSPPLARTVSRRSCKARICHGYRSCF